MSTAKLTLIGMYNFSEGGIFDLLELPEGIDKETLIDAILYNSGEFEILFSDLDVLTYAIGSWGKKWYDVFKKWKDTLNLEYHPLRNYDLYTERTDDRNIDSKTETDTITETDNTNTRENKVSAYNSSTYQPDETDTNTFEGSEESNGNIVGNTKDKKESRGHIYGLKPTMRSWSYAELVKGALDVAEWNLYLHMADIFTEELLIMVY